MSRSYANLLDLAAGDAPLFTRPSLSQAHQGMPPPQPRSQGGSKGSLGRSATASCALTDMLREDENSAASDTASSLEAQERLIVVANSLPLHAERDRTTQSWRFRWDEDALLLQMRSGIMNPEREDLEVIYVGCLKVEVDPAEQDRVAAHLLEKFNCVPAFLSPDLYSRYYHGFCKQQLWPLFHYLLPLSPQSGGLFDRELWQAYVQANKIFSDKVMEVISPEDDYVWVHDYHLMVLPTFLRKKFHRIRLGFFLHSPFPSSEIYRALPVREEILRALLNSDLIGFHTFDYARHFLSCCSRMLGLEYESKRGYIGLEYYGRTVGIKIMPVGVDMGRLRATLALPDTEWRLGELRAEFAGKVVVLGVDDMDIFKGLGLKLTAFEQMLRQHPEWVGKAVLVQITNPARGRGRDVMEAHEEVHTVARRLNAEFGREGYEPVVLYERPVPLYERIAFFALADCLVVTAVRDGMNLTPYEYIVSRQGPLGLVADSPGGLRPGPPRGAEASHLRTPPRPRHRGTDLPPAQPKGPAASTAAAAAAAAAAAVALGAAEGSGPLESFSVGEQHLPKAAQAGVGGGSSNSSSGGGSRSGGENVQGDVSVSLLAEGTSGLAVGPEGSSTQGSAFLPGGSAGKRSVIVVSEFIGCSPSLSGAIRINPWNTQAVADAMNTALTLPLREQELRHEKHFKYARDHDVAYWANSFFSDLQRTCKEHSRLRCYGIGFGLGFRTVALDPNFRKLQPDLIARAYARAHSRLLLLDYDGTMMPQASMSKTPSADVLAVINRLCADPRNTVFIVSGRTRSVLSEWFAPCDRLGLIAEHGYFFRWSGSQEWQTTAVAQGAGGSGEAVGAWKEAALPVMEVYTESTDGSYVEVKESALVWHHRDADPDFGAWQAKELLDHLESVLANEPVVVRSGHHTVEAKPQGVSKGLVLEQLLELLASSQGTSDSTNSITSSSSGSACSAGGPQGPKGGYPGFVLCVGDDRSDEDMFEKLDAITSGAVPGAPAGVEVFACTVGQKPSKAKYYLDDTSEVLKMLRTLTDTASAGGIGGGTMSSSNGNLSGSGPRAHGDGVALLQYGGGSFPPAVALLPPSLAAVMPPAAVAAATAAAAAAASTHPAVPKDGQTRGSTEG